MYKYCVHYVNVRVNLLVCTEYIFMLILVQQIMFYYNKVSSRSRDNFNIVESESVKISN